MHNISSTTSRHSFASSVYDEIKHNKSKSLNDNNFARFHYLLNRKMSQFSSESQEMAPLVSRNSINDSERLQTVRPASLKAEPRRQRQFRIKLNSHTSSIKKKSSVLELNILASEPQTYSGAADVNNDEQHINGVQYLQSPL